MNRTIRMFTRFALLVGLVIGIGTMLSITPAKGQTPSVTPATPPEGIGTESPDAGSISIALPTPTPTDLPPAEGAGSAADSDPTSADPSSEPQDVPSLQQYDYTDELSVGIEHGKTTIFLRVCSGAPTTQFRSEKPGVWVSELFIRPIENGCSPRPGNGSWRIVVGSDPGEQFKIYTAVSNGGLSEQDFYQQARVYNCSVNGPGNVSCALQNAPLQKIGHTPNYWAGVENGKTTIFLRVCAPGGAITFASEKPGVWGPEFFARGFANGCSPNPNGSWRVVVNADPGEEFKLASLVANRPFTEQELPFYANAEIRYCRVTAPGQIACSASSNPTPEPPTPEPPTPEPPTPEPPTPIPAPSVKHTIYAGVENGTTTIFLRACGAVNTHQFQSEKPGVWASAIFQRGFANGCSPRPNGGWRIVIGAVPGEQFFIRSYAGDGALDSGSFRTNAQQYSCTVTAPGQINCGTPDPGTPPPPPPPPSQGVRGTAFTYQGELLYYVRFDWSNDRGGSIVANFCANAAYHWLTYRELAPRPNNGERWNYGSINGCNDRFPAVNVLVGDEIEIGIGASNTDPQGGTAGTRYYKVTRTEQGLVAEFLRQTTPPAPPSPPVDSPPPPSPPVDSPPPPATRVDCSPLKYPVLLISGINDPDGGVLKRLRNYIRDQLRNQNNRTRCVILVSDPEDMKLEWGGKRGAVINPNLELGWMSPTNIDNFPKNIDLLKAGSGADKVAIVAYSQGGLQSRRYLESSYFPSRKDVALLITLGTPHLGSLPMLTWLACSSSTLTTLATGSSAECSLNPLMVASGSQYLQQPNGVMYYFVGGDNPASQTRLGGDGTDGVVSMRSSWFIGGSSIKEHQVERAVTDHCHSGGEAAYICNPDTTYFDSGARDGLWNKFILPILKGDPPQQYVFGGSTDDIRAKHSGKCLDIDGWSKGNGAALTQWDCHNGNNQQFRAVETGYELQHILLSNRFWIVAKHSGKCLDVSGSSKANNAKIVQWHCHGGNNQAWEQDGLFNDQLKSAHSGKCMDVLDAKKNNGARVVQWDCTFNTKNQQFSFDFGIPNLQQAIWGADGDPSTMPAQEPEAPAPELYPIEQQITFDTIAPGSTTTLTTTLDNSIGNLQFILYSTSGVSFTLRDADGNRYTPDNAGNQFWQLPDWGVMGAYGITGRMTGTWQIEITASPALTESVGYLVLAEFASPYAVLIVDRPTVVQPSTAIPLLARVTGLTGTNEIGVLVHRNGQPFTTGTLYDDGNHNDLVANDGYFGGALNGLSEAGEYDVIVEFTEGDIYRSTRTTLTVSPAWATLQGLPIQQVGLAAAGQRVYDAEVNVAEHGHYVVLGTLANRYGDAVSFARTTALLDPGTHTVPLTFTGDILDTIPDDELVLREVRLLEGMSMDTYQLTDAQEQRIMVNSTVITGTTASLTVQAGGIFSYAVLDFGDRSTPVKITERLFSTSHTYPEVGNYTVTVTLYAQDGTTIERNSTPIRIEEPASANDTISLPLIVRGR